MFLYKVNRELFDKINEYLTQARYTIDIYAESMNHYLTHRIDDHFETMVHRTHAAESDADDLKRDIEQMLYEKSLLPDSREDIFNLIDYADRLPNKAESILRRIFTQNIDIHHDYDDKVRELMQLGVETFDVVQTALTDSLTKRTHVQEYVRTIDSNESVGDNLEQKLVHQIFCSDCDPMCKLLSRDLVLEIGHMLDMEEQLADRITIFAIKRQV